MIVPVQTDLYAVVGNPAGHSLSPVMMNAAFKSLGVPAVYIALQADSFAEDLETISRMGFKGLSVTIPHKESAWKLASEIDVTARTIGAVNTLKRQENRWFGRNTDWIGSNRALKQTTELQGKRALVIGAGGAAKAVVFGLVQEGALVAVANRTEERGKALAAAFGCDFISLSDLSGSGADERFDIIVQCTPAGMSGAETTLPVSGPMFRPGATVMDIVYRPLLTPFLLEARESGCNIVNGLEMLLHQGAAQLEWWLDRPIPREEGIEVMRNALKGALGHE